MPNQRLTELACRIRYRITMKGLTGALVVLACLSVRFSAAQTKKETPTPTVSNAVRRLPAGALATRVCGEGLNIISNLAFASPLAA